MDQATIVAILVSAIGGGGLASLITAWAMLRREGREHGHAILNRYWDSYEGQVKSAAARGDSPEVDRLRREYEAQQEAWRAQQDLEGLAPTEISVVKDAPSLPTGEIEQLKRLLEQSQALSPAFLSAVDYFLRGNAHYAAEEYEEALAAFDRALELRPDDPETLMGRGATFWKLGRYDDALPAFNRALELRPDDHDTLVNRGGTLHQLGRYEEALAAYDHAHELRSDHPEALRNRGATLHYLGRHEEALADFNRSLEIRPDDGPTLVSAAISLDHLHRTGESLKMYARAIDVEPRQVLNRVNRASLEAKLGDLSAAQADLDWALEHGDLETFRRESAARAREHPYFEPLRADPGLLDRLNRILGSD